MIRPQPDSKKISLDLSRASSGARVSAYVIDLLLFVLLAIALYRLGIPLVVERLLWAGYLVFCHLATGQTLGKKICKIKVVSLEGELTRKQLVWRETVYRILSFLTFGFLRAFIARDGAALHDLLAKTRVVSLESRNRGEEIAPPLKAAIVFGALASLVGGVLYVALFTSLPLKELASQAELRGVQIKGIRGSLMRGVAVERLGLANSSGSLELEGLRLSVDIPALFRHGVVRVNRLTVHQGKVVMNKSTHEAQGEQQIFLIPMEIEALDVADFRLVMNDHLGNPKFNQKKEYNFARFYLNAMKITAEKIAVARLYVESDVANADIPELELTGGILHTGVAHALIKRKTLPPEVKKDLDIHGSFEIDLAQQKVRKLELLALDSRVKLSALGLGDSSEGATVGVNVNNLNVADYYPLAAPVANLSLKGRITADLTPSISWASFNLRSLLFLSENGSEFHFARGEKTFAIVVNPSSLGGDGSPLFWIKSGNLVSIEDWLSDLYFEKNFALLLAEQKTVIEGDRAHFALPPILSPADSVAPRTPANLMSPAQ